MYMQARRASYSATSRAATASGSEHAPLQTGGCRSSSSAARRLPPTCCPSTPSWTTAASLPGGHLLPTKSISTTTRWAATMKEAIAPAGGWLPTTANAPGRSKRIFRDTLQKTPLSNFANRLDGAFAFVGKRALLPSAVRALGDSQGNKAERVQAVECFAQTAAGRFVAQSGDDIFDCARATEQSPQNA